MSARVLVRQDGAVREAPLEDLSELRDRVCWVDIADPEDEDLMTVAKELGLHPLALEDARERNERPKIDRYEAHGFLVFYAIDAPEPDLVKTQPVSIFVAPNALVTVHTGPLGAAADLERRFREGRLETVSTLLHALLDALVDRYFPVVDAFGDRVDLLESLIVDDAAGRGLQTSLRELFRLKRELVRLRQVIAPEREVLAVLARDDLPGLEGGRAAYFQDVYDHVVRVTDEIDTFRDLTSNVIDAHLAAASNRLNEVVKVLTSVATVLLVMTLITGFFGMNFEAIPFGSETLFWTALGVLGASAVALGVYFRRQGWL